MCKDDIKFISFIFLIFVVILIFFNYFNEYQCDNFQEVTGRESKWVFMDACYVKDDKDRWIRYDSAYKE